MHSGYLQDQLLNLMIVFAFEKHLLLTPSIKTSSKPSKILKLVDIVWKLNDLSPVENRTQIFEAS